MQSPQALNRIMELVEPELVNSVKKLSNELLPVIEYHFGWKTIKVNGHDTKDLNKKFKVVQKFKNVPKVLLAKTTKGKGIKFMENVGMWHHRIPSESEFVKINHILS